MNSTCVPYMPGDVAAPTSIGDPQRRSSSESVGAYSSTPPGSDPDLDPNKVHHHLQISYEGRVSLVSEAIYDKSSSTPDDSCDDMRPSPGSPSTKASSEDNKEGSDSDGARDSVQSREVTSLDSLERLRQICHSALSGGGRTEPSSLDGDRDTPSSSSLLFHCHLCAFTSGARDEFNDHVNDHYEFRCPKCDFATKVEADYRAHLHDDHDLSMDDLEEEQGLRVPQVNSQGKVKTLKCKQCDYVTVTKEEFWRHVKGHIKPEKLLTCPKCMFVTEYKHHLEYHLRNHFGSKPFKCPQCHYSCVNKSMLSSHMKSHTTVYQYRCKDCNYATKYCHSLKLHLRKYGHKPAMVLNPDGTPNPLPIVDVYGTRRGPKIKRDDQGNIIGPPQAVAFQKLGQTAKASTNPTYPVLPSYMMQQLQQKMPLFGAGRAQSFSHDDMEDDLDDDMDEEEEHQPESSPYRRGTVVKQESFTNQCTICDFETSDPDIFRNHMVLHATRDRDRQMSPQEPPKEQTPKQFPDSQPSSRNLSGLLDSHLMESDDLYKMSTKPRVGQEGQRLPDSSNSAADYFEYLKQMAPLLKRGSDPVGSSSVSTTSKSVSPPPSSLGLQGYVAPPVHGSSLLSRLYLGSVVKNFQQRESPFAGDGDRDSNASSSGALDLSQGYEVKSNGGTDTPCSGLQSGRSSNKRCRKGRAFKIERKSDSFDGNGDSSSVMSGGSSEPEDSKSEESGGRETIPSRLTTPGVAFFGSDADKIPSAVKLSGSHVCQPCQIAFMDLTMFLQHSDCHDRDNPLKCIKCGLLMEDAKDFYVHLLSDPHA